LNLNSAARELSLKIVYCGPPLGGKTSNVKALHQAVAPAHRGRLMSLDSGTDRTRFFDMLPMALIVPTPHQAPFTLRLRAFSVPGQLAHATTRKVVLEGVDGVVFVADSRLEETQANAASFSELRAHLTELGRGGRSLAIAMQFNKRDLAEIRSDEELEALATESLEPVFRAVAIRGEGVRETFLAIVAIIWARLDRRGQLTQLLGLNASNVADAIARSLGWNLTVADCAAASVAQSFDLAREFGP
jgi:signal recognition particle receptor subunit beta